VASLSKAASEDGGFKQQELGFHQEKMGFTLWL